MNKDDCCLVQTSHHVTNTHSNQFRHNVEADPSEHACKMRVVEILASLLDTKNDMTQRYTYATIGAETYQGEGISV